MPSSKELREKLITLTSISEQDIDQRIAAKKSEFPAVSDDGLVSLVARDLGVNVFAPFRKELKIGNIMPDMRNIAFIGKVTDLSPVRDFVSNGRSGRVRNVTIEDETGKIRVALWNDEIDKYALGIGDTVKVDNCSTRQNTFGGVEARLNFGTLTKTDAVVDVRGPRTSLAGAEENDEIAVNATLLHVFERQMIYAYCPECRQRLTDNTCAEHGTVTPRKTLIVSGLIDDGSSTMNAVFFNQAGERLFDMKIDDIEQRLAVKSSAEFILESNALAKTFKITGSMRRNQLTNELELRVRNVE